MKFDRIAIPDESVKPVKPIKPVKLRDKALRKIIRTLCDAMIHVSYIAHIQKGNIFRK